MFGFNSTKAALADPTVYHTICLWWGTDELRMHDVTFAEAYDRAVIFGYSPPVWYKPWQYLMGGLGMVTVGYGTRC